MQQASKSPAAHANYANPSTQAWWAMGLQKYNLVKCFYFCLIGRWSKLQQTLQRITNCVKRFRGCHRGAGQWKRKSHRFTLANDACKYSCSCSDLMEFSHWFHKWCKSTSEHRSLYVTSFTICWLILNFIQGYFNQVVPQCEQLQRLGFCLEKMVIW